MRWEGEGVTTDKTARENGVIQLEQHSGSYRRSSYHSCNAMIRLLTDITLTPTYLEDIELRAFDVKLNGFEGATAFELVKDRSGKQARDWNSIPSDWLPAAIPATAAAACFHGQ